MQQLVEKILGEIRNQGAIPFARFMELALYCPVYGYYEKEGDTVGRRGDYYTSVSVGPLFGELLARQFVEWLRELELDAERRVSGEDLACGPTSGPGLAAGRAPSPRPWQIVEAGAHRGELARDILSYLRAHEPDLMQRIDYCLVEPSPRRQGWQRRTLAEFANQVRWVTDLPECGADLPGRGSPSPHRRGVRGIIFSNELLDALPVHRLGWDAAQKRWFEWGVTCSDGHLKWIRLPEPGGVTGAELSTRVDPLAITGPWWPEALLENLPDGFAMEVCPAACQWWVQAASRLEAGKLLTLDYGLVDEERLTGARLAGTLRAYYRHHLSPDVLAQPGEQDITAHVDFSALRRVGESAGLTTEGLFSQEQFLTRIALRLIGVEASAGQWTPQRTRQFQALTHPDHLGRSFRALVQSRSGPG